MYTYKRKGHTKVRAQTKAKTQINQSIIGISYL